MRRSPGKCGGRDGRVEVGAGARLLVGALVGGLVAIGPVGLSGQAPEEEAEPSQEGAARHEVDRGDTLWDLARRYLSDPFQWPEIFELNRDVVEDPHWIYPGENLRLPGGAARDAARVADRTETRRAAPVRQDASEREGVSGFGGASVFDESPSSGSLLGSLGVEEYRPAALVSASDFYRAPFLAQRSGLGPTAVTARKIEGNPLGLSLPAAVRRHHEVVLTLNGLAVERGQRLQAIRVIRSLGTHGEIVRPMAVLVVGEVMGDSARAKVLDVFQDYRVGDLVVAAEPFGLDPESRLEPVQSGFVTGVIGYELEQVLLGQGDMVFLDAGSGAGVELGDEFAVFAPEEGRPASAAWEDRMAVVRVVRVRPATATAMVVDLQDVGIAPGVPARLVFRASGE